MAAPKGLDPKAANIISQWTYDRPLNTCRFNPAGTFVFCGAEDANVERFNVADGARTNFSGGHDTWVQAIGFSKDGSQIYSGGCGGKITWGGGGAKKPKTNRSLGGPKRRVFPPDVNPHSK